MAQFGPIRRPPRRYAYTILESGYWRDPVQVFAGATWLVIGIIVGSLFGIIAAFGVVCTEPLAPEKVSQIVQGED